MDKEVLLLKGRRVLGGRFNVVTFDGSRSYAVNQKNAEDYAKLLRSYGFVACWMHGSQFPFLGLKPRGYFAFWDFEGACPECERIVARRGDLHRCPKCGWSAKWHRCVRTILKKSERSDVV